MTIRELLIDDTKIVIRANPGIRIALALLQVALTKADYMDYYIRLNMAEHKVLKDAIAEQVKEATNGH